MTDTNLDRLRAERELIHGSASAGIKIAKTLGSVARGLGNQDRSAELVASLLVVQAITNLADTIQMIHERGDQACGP